MRPLLGSPGREAARQNSLRHALLGLPVPDCAAGKGSCKGSFQVLGFRASWRFMGSYKSKWGYKFPRTGHDDGCPT